MSTNQVSQCTGGKHHHYGHSCVRMSVNMSPNVHDCIEI